MPSFFPARLLFGVPVGPADLHDAIPYPCATLTFPDAMSAFTLLFLLSQIFDHGVTWLRCGVEPFLCCALLICGLCHFA